MIVDPSNLQRRHPVLASDPADIGPNAPFDLRVDEINSVFGAENDVVVTLRIGVGHFFNRR